MSNSSMTLTFEKPCLLCFLSVGPVCGGSYIGIKAVYVVFFVVFFKDVNVQKIAP
jgi:hypothetical protein